MYLRIALALATAAGAACASKTDGLTNGLSGDSSLPDCGFDVLESSNVLPLDSCLDGDAIAGPAVFTREQGKPQVYNLPFALDADGSVCLHVINGGESRTERTASAEITVDDSPALLPKHFNPGVEVAQARLTAATGQHDVAVNLKSSPGSYLSVEVRRLQDIDDPDGVVVGEAGQLKAFDLHADPRIFSPNNNGIRDTTTLAIAADFVVPVPGNAGKATYEVEVDFDIASAEHCGALLILSQTFAVEAPQTVRLAEVWDGADSTGTTVPDGFYFYRARMRAFKVSSGGQRVLMDQLVSGIQKLQVTSDDEPPVLIVDEPRGPTSSTHDDTVGVAGFVTDASGVRQLTLETSSVVLHLAIDDADAFEQLLTLDEIPDGLLSFPTEFKLLAIDNVDNEFEIGRRMDRFRRAIPGERVIQAHPTVPFEVGMAAILAENGQFRAYVPRVNIYVIAWETEANAAAADLALAATNKFASIEPNSISLAASTTPRDSWYNGPGNLDQGSLKTIGMEDAWDITTGSHAVTVGISDTGIDYNHPEFYDNIFLNIREMPVGDAFADSRRIVDSDGNGVITMIDLNAQVNRGKVPGHDSSFEVFPDSLIDRNPVTDDIDVGFEGDLNMDGAPGIAGVDDDLDGGIDWADIDVATADYDSDGRPTCGMNGLCFDANLCEANPTFCDDLEDRDIHAPRDDDENGVADDIIGANFGQSENLLNVLERTNDPMDRNGHGTKVAGIIGATESQFGPLFHDKNIVGINWDVRILAVRTSVAGSTANSNANEAVTNGYFASMARFPDNNLRVVNHSFGSDPVSGAASDTIKADIALLDYAGVQYVVSAGNEGVDLDNPDNPKLSFPQSFANPNIISVAASSGSGELISRTFGGGSNFGVNQVDISAPGGTRTEASVNPYLITTTVLSDMACIWYLASGGLPFDFFPFLQCQSGYDNFQGTSAAAPHVAGVLALMQASNPTLGHTTLRRLLLSNVNPGPFPLSLGDFGPLPVSSGGLLDAAAAVAASSVEPSPADPTAIAGSNTGPTISGDGQIVAFLSNRITESNPFGRQRIWLSTATGSMPVEMVIPPSPAGAASNASAIDPSLSFDGSVLTYASDRDDDGADLEIWVTRFVPGTLQIVENVQRTFNDVDDHYPAISGDGQFVAFASPYEQSSDTFGDYEIFRITANAETPGLVIDQDDIDAQITNDNEADFAPLSTAFADDRRPTLSDDGLTLAWVTFIGKSTPAGDELSVATFDATTNQLTSIASYNPVPDMRRKAGVALAGSPLRLFFGGIFRFDAACSMALDGTDVDCVDVGGSVVVGVAPNGQFSLNLGVGFVGRLARTNLLSGEETILAADLFGTPEDPTRLIYSCGLGEQDDLFNAFDHVNPVCEVAASEDGTTVVFVATPEISVDGAERPRDIYLFQEGQGTTRITN